MTGSGRSPYVGALWALGALVAIFFAGTQAIHFAPAGAQVATWWPAAGIAVSLLSLAPRSWWPALAAGVVLSSGAANLAGGRALDISLCFGLANAAEAVVAARLLRRGAATQPRFESLDDFLRLL
ncbi:MAG TPA: MASE1 domain-containing protein, partial [Nocardioides sp.]|nr:MASE1 domain-containing protein [Nocardioides sp.]